MRGALLSLTLLALGCAHARQVESPSVGTPAAASQAAAPAASGTLGPPQPKRAAPSATRQAPAGPGHPGLSASPQGLLKAFSVRQIQGALTAHGYATEATGLLDGATEAHLRAFQGSRKLPETGLPDAETLRQLGLKPDDIFRSNPE